MCVNGFSTILTLIVSVHAGGYGMGIYAIMLPSSVFPVAHWLDDMPCVSGMTIQCGSTIKLTWEPVLKTDTVTLCTLKAV